MSFRIRPARAEDVPLIAAWTRDTFAWGDYVPDALGEWLEDADSEVAVCVYRDDVPVAMARAQMLGPTEAWLSAARVHPEHRRAGLGMALNDHGVEWARRRGAQVARLAVEEENRAARGQVEKSGYRATCTWMHATAPPSTGRRLEQAHRLRTAPSGDTDAAWVFWAQSDLARAGRELISEGWRWRKARGADLEEAARRRHLWQSPAGWVVAAPHEDRLEVRWLATSSTDAPLLFQGLRDLAREVDAEEVEAKVPHTAWSAEALQREGFETRPVLIYAKGL